MDTAGWEMDLTLLAGSDRLGVAKLKGITMNKAEQARAKAERSALSAILRERSRSNASGVHANKGERRARTRSARKAVALREW